MQQALTWKQTPEVFQLQKALRSATLFYRDCEYFYFRVRHTISSLAVVDVMGKTILCCKVDDRIPLGQIEDELMASDNVFSLNGFRRIHIGTEKRIPLLKAKEIHH
jgi:hypothetical protein